MERLPNCLLRLLERRQYCGCTLGSNYPRKADPKGHPLSKTKDEKEAQITPLRGHLKYVYRCPSSPV